MSEKPIMHGRDHRLGGMDPIPFPDVPRVSAQYTSGPSHSVGTGALYTVAFNSIVYDSGSLTVGSSPYTEFEIQEAGLYLAMAEVVWAATSETSQRVSYFNSTGDSGLLTRSEVAFPSNPNASEGTLYTLSAIFEGAASDIVTLVVSHSRASAVTVSAESFALHRLSA